MTRRRIKRGGVLTQQNFHFNVDDIHKNHCKGRVTEGEEKKEVSEGGQRGENRLKIN